MLLAIDVGNTNIVLGVFVGEALTASWRLATLHDRTADEIRVLVSRLFEERQIAMTAVEGVIIASVVPPLTRPMTEMVERCFEREPLMVEPGTQTGMPVLYDSPDEVGADRVVNGVAAFEFYGRPHGQPVIVVDFGTATTFDAISAKGEYLGGGSFVQASRSRPTRCSSAPRACHASRCEGLPSSSGVRPSDRCSLACSTVTSPWWRGSSSGCAWSCNPSPTFAPSVWRLGGWPMSSPRRRR